LPFKPGHNGFKPKGAVSTKTKLIRELITDQDGEDALQKVKELAFNNEGDVNPLLQIKMLELLLAYKYGKPQQSIDLTSGEEKIDAIRVIMVSNGTGS
jgi:hypothetical protein